MKKFIAFLLCAASLFAFSSCGGKGGEAGENVPSKKVDATPVSDELEVLFTKEIKVDDTLTVAVDFAGKGKNVKRLDVKSDGEQIKSVDVTKISSEYIGNDSGAVSSDSEFLFKSGDYNFDGKTDFMIQSWETSGDGKAYYVFLWNDSSSVFDFGFQAVDPLFDISSKRIYSTVMKDSEEYVYVYEVKGGKVELVDNFNAVAKVSFSEELSEYEQYMEPADRDGYLILVNKSELLDSDYVPEDLAGLADTRGDRKTQQMRLSAAKSLEAMFKEMRRAGYTDVSVTSAYRSYSYQDYLYNMYIEQEMSRGYSRERAREIVDTYSAAPGTSEHQSGLCCDMHNLPSADQAFAKKEVYGWLCENAWKFGFILRFPEDKEDITTYEFEPWHYRFVGRYHAQKIYRFGLCLEEYLELIGK